MIVTLTGAYKNIGDHLIGDRATRLLRKFSDEDIINIDRKAITESSYEQFNKAKCVILCGGPAYQKNMHTIYPIDLMRIKRPIVPFGLGWKGSLSDTPNSFHFASEAKDFIQHIHKNISVSSCRDGLTQDVLKNTNVNNVLMTGCPVWYDLEYLEKDFQFTAENQIKTLTFSTPAVLSKNCLSVIHFLSKRFPKARKICTFHHGFLPSNRFTGYQRFVEYSIMAAYAKAMGFEILSMPSDLSMIKIYDQSDLHVGYRVHAHIYCLSRRKTTFLINEDSRGVGQARSLGFEEISNNNPNLVEQLSDTLDSHFSSGGNDIKNVVTKMQTTFSVMSQFLKTI